MRHHQTRRGVIPHLYPAFAEEYDVPVFGGSDGWVAEGNDLTVVAGPVMFGKDTLRCTTVTHTWERIRTPVFNFVTNTTYNFIGVIADVVNSNTIRTYIRHSGGAQTLQVYHRVNTREIFSQSASDHYEILSSSCHGFAGVQVVRVRFRYTGPGTYQGISIGPQALNASFTLLGGAITS